MATGKNKSETPAKEKSILDGVPVEDKAFPLNKKVDLPAGSLASDFFTVVSSCPHCGSPIYGKATTRTDDLEVAVRFTCDCSNKTKSSMQHLTK